MINLQIFNNDSFGTVRVFMIDGKPGLVSADVYKSFSIDTSRQADCRSSEIDKNTVISNDGISENQNKTKVCEAGLYSQCLFRRKKEAEYMHRVASKILPTIRKIGGYEANFCDYYVNESCN